MLGEAVDALRLREGSIAVDATGGGGGHSERIIETIGASGTLMTIDRDPVVVEALTSRFASHPNVHVVEGDFRTLERLLAEQHVAAPDGILADLGWNSMQFEQGSRGFSFLKEEPLEMTYGTPADYPFTAKDIVGGWSEEVIADVIYAYADERYARRIAKAIVEARERTPIETSTALAEIVKGAVPPPYRRARIHPATKTFQALRIAVNDELEALKEFLNAAVKALKPGGRLAVISFHSVEDRIVKQFMRDMEHAGIGTLGTKKPVAPSPEEVRENPRARSAKLRTFHIL